MSSSTYIQVHTHTTAQASPANQPTHVLTLQRLTYLRLHKSATMSH